MATRTFFKGLMASEDVQKDVISVIFQENGVNAEVADGSFVTLGDLITDTVYGESLVDYNTYYASAPTAANAPVVVVDIAGVSEGTIAGNVYKLGVKQYDLVGPEGRPVRARRLELNDKFWLSDGCFDSTPVVGEYAVLQANKTTLATANAAATEGLCLKIWEDTDLTAGQASKGKKYLVEVLGI